MYKRQGETLRNQQKLSDDAYRDLQDGQEGDQPGKDQNDKGSDGKSLAERQQDLRDGLDGLNKDGKLPGKGSEKGDTGRQELDRAGRAMEGAEQALRDGNLPDAMDKQAEAMDAMRQGLKNFGEALAQEAQRNGTPGQQPAEGQDERDGSRDPLGRNNGDSSRIGSDKNLLQLSLIHI